MIKIIKARKGFYHELFVLVIPIVIQNLIASAVIMADVVMLGRVDQTSISASSLAGQVMFLLNVVFFGLNSALTILAAQYWGKRDTKTISKILGIGLIISLVITVSLALAAFFFPHYVIRVWTNVPELIDAGAVYLRYVAPSYIFLGIAQPYLTILKSCERVMFSTTLSASTLVLNVILNALLIFGLGPFPEMGIAGAALATTICWAYGVAVCIIDFCRQKILPKNIIDMFRIPRELVSDFAKYSLPAFINDAMWGLAFNMNSIIMGHLGSDIVAANSVVSVARDLVTVVGFGISAAASIMLGKEIGENRLEDAVKDASSIMKVAVLSGIISGFALFAISPVVPGLVKISATAAHYLRIMLYINVFYQMGQIVNTVLIASLFRCGGDSKYGMVLDIACMWGFAVPLGLISAFVLKLPPIIVYALMCTDEFAKMPFAIRHYMSKKWIRNITREIN
ncbi:MATE family efflux transporter [Butyrivibrio sp. WCD3002]|uniref:MATE family efflux transporter n=1 Tax=Butyrivibrio sp. WCD3002 TaxID=1280676 RepID=UPI0004191A81|nr:MATE family efflux transporter [Butyrivibrio sp. WCD3002]